MSAQPKQPKQPKPRKPVKFEELLDRLEGIVRDLEGGRIGLDEALAKYEEGIAALRQCHAILQGAEKRIALLTANPDGTFLTAPFAEEKGGESLFPKE